VHFEQDVIVRDQIVQQKHQKREKEKRYSMKVVVMASFKAFGDIVTY